jgi:LytS/YehU family sensor histidine kinase
LWDVSSVFLFYGAAMGPALLLYRHLRPDTPGVLRRVLPALVAWVAFHVLVQFAFTTVEYFLIAPLRGGETFTYLQVVYYHTIRRVPVSLLLFLGGIVFIEHRRATWALAREERRRQEVTSELTAARLAALSGQLQPHFLFNTLNAIASLVARDPQAAERMIERLSDLLRASLAEGRESTIPLSREMDLVDDFLAIHAARFPDRFSYAVAVPEALHRFPVPPLVLQPLVENAIRHGLDHRLEPGRLEVHAVADGEGIRLVVDDDGIGIRLPLAREGIGLSNVTSRLRAIYGTSAQMQIAPRATGGTRVTLLLPQPLSATALPET